MKNISSIIKEKRVALGMTQEQLAQKLLVSRQAVSNWERNKTYPDLDKLKEIAEMFNVTIDEMLYSDVKTNRNRQLFYKRILYMIIIIIIAISSITFYRAIYPPHIAIITKYKRPCNNDTVSLYKKSYELPNGDIIENYTFGLEHEVEFEFGLYCVPLSTNVKVTNNQWADAVVTTNSLAPGFTIEAEHFFESLYEGNMHIFMHHTIAVMEDTQDRIYYHSANADIAFSFTYPMEEQEHFTTKVSRRWRDG